MHSCWEGGGGVDAFLLGGGGGRGLMHSCWGGGVDAFLLGGGGRLGEGGRVGIGWGESGRTEGRKGTGAPGSQHYDTVILQSDIQEELRDTIKFAVDRSTHADKLRDFHEWMAAVKKDTIHHVCRAKCCCFPKEVPQCPCSH